MNKNLRTFVLCIMFIICILMFLLSCAAPPAALIKPDIETPSTLDPSANADTLQPIPHPIIIEIEIEKELEQSFYPQEFANTRNDNLKHLMACKDRLAAAESMRQGALDLGYAETHPVVELANKEIEQIKQDIEFYEECWNQCAIEHPVASEVWRFFIEECGYPEPVVAGLLGNMMVECGGYTLDLQWWIYNSTKHYGLVQWSPKYYPHMQGATLRTQLEYLKESIPEVFNGWSGKREGCLFNDFLSMTDSKEAAYIFAVVYERPGSIGENRSDLSITALNYFCGAIKHARAR